MILCSLRSRAQPGKAGRCRLLILVSAIVLFAGMFAQITLLSRHFRIGKQISAVEREMKRFRRQASDLELQINETHNLEQVAARARQLGMEQPTETQIRTLRAAQYDVEDTSTQAAEVFSGEKVLN